MIERGTHILLMPEDKGHEVLCDAGYISLVQGRLKG